MYGVSVKILQEHVSGALGVLHQVSSSWKGLVGFDVNCHYYIYRDPVTYYPRSGQYSKVQKQEAQAPLLGRASQGRVPTPRGAEGQWPSPAGFEIYAALQACPM